MLEYGRAVTSPGGSFQYLVIGPCCRLFDREELPWPCCRLAWKGKEPSWNRVGQRFVPDLAASRCPSYAVQAVDIWGHSWSQVLTLYYHRLSKQEKDWWVTKKPKNKPYPGLPFAGA
jgi:hypothetical protein